MLIFFIYFNKKLLEGVYFWDADRTHKRNFTNNSSHPYTTYQTWTVGTEGKKANPTALTWDTWKVLNIR